MKTVTLNSIDMAESIAFSRGSEKSAIYDEIVPQIETLIEGEADLVANLANVAAVLKEAFDFFWVGFYIAKDGELVLGPFQGPLACTRIKFGDGVCGQAFSTAKTVIVPNVDEFPGHIACSTASRSEVVVPIFGPGKVPIGVLDVDSDLLNDLNETDARGLERIAAAHFERARLADPRPNESYRISILGMGDFFRRGADGVICGYRHRQPPVARAEPARDRPSGASSGSHSQLPLRCSFTPSSARSKQKNFLPVILSSFHSRSTISLFFC